MSLAIEIAPGSNRMKSESRSSKVRVFLKSQSAGSLAQHSASKTFALTVLSFGSTARWTDDTQTAIQLLTEETWRQVKDRVRNATFTYVYGHKVMCPALLPIGPHSVGNLDLCYPEKGRESGRHPHEAMRRACAEAKARQEQN